MEVAGFMAGLQKRGRNFKEEANHRFLHLYRRASLCHPHSFVLLLLLLVFKTSLFLSMIWYNQHVQRAQRIRRAGGCRFAGDEVLFSRIRFVSISSGPILICFEAAVDVDCSTRQHAASTEQEDTPCIRARPMGIENFLQLYLSSTSIPLDSFPQSRWPVMTRPKRSPLRP